MGVKTGYRQTDVGVVPDDWRVETISQLLEDKSIIGHLDGNHGELYPRSSEFRDHGVPYIGANDFADGFVSFEQCKFVNPERAAQFRKGVAIDGDILFAHNATVGPVAMLRTIEPFVILSTTATYFRCNKVKLSNSYLKYALQSLEFVRQYQAVMAQSTRFQVPITAQRKLSLIIPPFLEQSAIASALGDIEALIAKLDKLITKKRDLKQAVMRQLLSGQTRLPGFNRMWKLKRLDELTFIVNGGTPKTSEAAFWSGSIKWCTPTDITRCSGKYLVETERTISEDGLMSCSARLLPVGSLLLCTRATIGEVRIAGCEICTNQGFKSLICKPGVSNEFLYYILLTKKSQMIERAIGSTFLELSKRNAAALEFTMPEYSEQVAIAEVLSDIDAEITAIERRREKTRALKQGMMQELLTGRTRLI